MAGLKSLLAQGLGDSGALLQGVADAQANMAAQLREGYERRRAEVGAKGKAGATGEADAKAMYSTIKERLESGEWGVLVVGWEGLGFRF
jgi:hypothetical protein